MYKIKWYFRKSSLSFLVIKPSFDMIYYWKCLSCSSSRNNMKNYTKNVYVIDISNQAFDTFQKKNLLNLQLIEQVYQNDQFDLWELFSEICWLIWYPRNKIRVNDVQGLPQLMMYNADSVNNSSVSNKLRPWARKDYLTGYFLQIVKFFFIRNLWISLPILLVVEFPNLLAC